MEQLSKKCTVETNSNSESGNQAASPEMLPGGSMDSNEERCGKSSIGESDSITELVQGSVETPLAESEQATYASANNDLKGTKAYQEADVPGLHNLAMAIIDYRGHRVVAQVKPSIFSILGEVVRCGICVPSSAQNFLFSLELCNNLTLLFL